MTDHHLFIFLLQIFLLLGLSRLGGEVFNRFHQPALTAEIFVGILLGPTVLGHFFPAIHAFIFPNEIIQQTMFETVAWMGAFFLLLETGLEIDFSSAWRQRGDALKIALADTLIPMILGFALAWFLPDQYLAAPGQRLSFALFIAVILTTSAMPITARVLHDLNLNKTDLGFLIMSALSVNDIIGWLLFTLVFGFFVQTGASISSILGMFAGALAFVLFCLTIGRFLSNWAVNQMKALKLPEPASSLTYIFLLGVLCAAAAKQVGLHALFGFFLAGIMAGEARSLSEKTRQTISQMVYAIFVPLFFAGIGLKMDFLKYFDPWLVLFISAAGIGLRFFGAWVGVQFTNVPKVNRSAVAIAHTPGGMMEIVMGLLALEYHLITPTVFIAIVFGALITAIVMGPWLSWRIAKRSHVSVFEYFARRGIVIPLRVKTRDEAIMQLAKVASDESGINDEDLVANAVLQRENLMGTAIEDGVALPHGRVEGLRKPIVVFARSLSGVEWNSPDGKPSQFIFLILTPLEDDGVHVQILRAIAQVMQDPTNIQNILNAKESEQIWHTFQNAFTQLYVKRGV